MEPLRYGHLNFVKKSDTEAVTFTVTRAFQCFVDYDRVVSSESVWAISIARLNKLPVLTPATYLRLRLKRPF